MRCAPTERITAAADWMKKLKYLNSASTPRLTASAAVRNAVRRSLRGRRMNLERTEVIGRGRGENQEEEPPVPPSVKTIPAPGPRCSGCSRGRGKYEQTDHPEQDEEPIVVNVMARREPAGRRRPSGPLSFAPRHRALIISKKNRASIAEGEIERLVHDPFRRYNARDVAAHPGGPASDDPALALVERCRWSVLWPRCTR